MSWISEPLRNSSSCTVFWLAVNGRPVINTLSLVSIVCLLKGIFFFSRLHGARVASLKKLKMPRTKNPHF